jgi:carbonic anhydrase
MMQRRTGILMLGLVTLLPQAAGASNPAAALEALKAGNARFEADASTTPRLGRLRRVELARGQAPFAIVLSCADSRVPPELVFNVGLGDLFVVRAAGEVVDKSILASVEYAAEHLHAPLLVVMGHEACGAVKAASGPRAPLGPNLDYLIDAIRPAVQRTATRPEAERLKAAILANVDEVIARTLAGSALLRGLVDAGELQVVGAYYELESGRVHFSPPTPHATTSERRSKAAGTRHH